MANTGNGDPCNNTTPTLVTGYSEEDHAVDPRHVLANFGVDEFEERIYEILLKTGGGTILELEGFIDLPRQKIETLVAQLNKKGMVSYTPAQPIHYFPTPPDVVVETLTNRYTQKLAQTRAAATRILSEMQEDQPAQFEEPKVVEIITSPEAQSNLFNQIQRSAHEEVIAFKRPPYVWSPRTPKNRELFNLTQLEMMKRGLRYRGIYGHLAFEQPGGPQRVNRYIRGGELVRVCRSIPLKMIAADHRIALLPLDMEKIEGPALLVRTSSLLNGLWKLFENTWQRSLTITTSGHDGPDLGKQKKAFSPTEERLIQLLASGLNDKTMTGHLGIAPRTFDRRIKALMIKLEAKTRFQAGWSAAQKLSHKTDQEE